MIISAFFPTSWLPTSHTSSVPPNSTISSAWIFTLRSNSFPAVNISLECEAENTHLYGFRKPYQPADGFYADSPDFHSRFPGFEVLPEEIERPHCSSYVHQSHFDDCAKNHLSHIHNIIPIDLRIT